MLSLDMFRYLILFDYNVESEFEYGLADCKRVDKC